MVTATENSVNTAFIDMTLGDGGRPRRRSSTPPTGWASRPANGRAQGGPGFPNTSPGLEPITGVALGNATVSPINMANAYATLANDGTAAEPYIIEKVVLANGETDYQHKVSAERGRRRGHRRRRQLCPPAGRGGGLRHRRARRSTGPPPARPAPRPTAPARSPRPGSPATPASSAPRSCTSAARATSSCRAGCRRTSAAPTRPRPGSR